MDVGSFGNNRPAASPGRGFTLVELLIVMAVIGILAAILFPAMIKVREAAKISDCLANMRQLGAGLHMYLDDNDLRFPPASPWGSPAYWRKISGQKTIQECLFPYVRNGMAANSDGTYRKSGVFVCPSDNGISLLPKTTYGVPCRQPLWKYAGCSYEYYATNQDSENDQKKSGVNRIRWTGLSPEVISPKGLQRLGAPYRAILYPSRKAVMGDADSWHMGDTIPVNLLAYRNTLFADGHAARVPGIDHLDARQDLTLVPWHTYREIEE